MRSAKESAFAAFIFLFAFGAVFAGGHGSSADAQTATQSASPAHHAIPVARPEGSAGIPQPVSMSLDTTLFEKGIVLGSDVTCTTDGTLRFHEKQLQLCIGEVWHTVVLRR